MSIIIDTTDGPLEFNDFAIRAITAQAERQAAMVADFLGAMGIFPPGKPIRLPAACLLELGAALQLRSWEEAGVCVPGEAPPAKQALVELADRITKDAAQVGTSFDSPLSRQVLEIWRKYFCWDAQAILGAEVLAGAVDEDALVDALAPLLWQHRNLLAGEETTNEVHHDAT